MKVVKLKLIRQIFMGMLFVTTVFGVVAFSSRTIFASDVFARKYQFSIIMRVDTIRCLKKNFSCRLHVAISNFKIQILSAQSIRLFW